MFCTQCGAQLKENDRFCANCGKATDAPASAGYAAPPPPPTQVVPYRPLRRIMSQKKIAGVCAGFAEYFEMDVTLMRILFIVLVVTPPGVGLLAYLVAWIAMPRDI